MTITFSDADLADIPMDTAPEVSDVEYPCRVCGREAGPYGGRGRKPVHCDEHKKNPVKVSKVSGKSADLAAQATAVLVQVNGIIATVCMATGLFQTAGAIAKANPAFEEAARNALITDPELCRLITKSGAVSGKAMLVMAYAGMGIAVGPVAAMELKEKKMARAERQAEKEYA